MAFERIELNICPAGDMPVFHCSQYDVGRPIIIDLLNGDDAFTPSAGTTFELHCRKVDDNIVTLDTYEVDGNTLTVEVKWYDSEGEHTYHKWGIRK